MSEQLEYHTEHINGQKHMECKCCGVMCPCSDNVTGLTCSQCVRENYEKDFPYQASTGYVSTGRPRGWAFMKEFVDKNGNVHKGKEQLKLKGTLPPTVIKPKAPKPKLTKAQKAQQRTDAFAKIHKLKKELTKVKFKKDVKRINSEINKLQKTVK